MREEDTPSERVAVQEKSPPARQVSPNKLRAAMLKGRFADLIVRSQEKSLPDHKVTSNGVGCVGGCGGTFTRGVVSSCD